jgi:type IV secretion system protein VirB5
VNALKRLLAATAAALGLLAGSAAQAGIPVIDGANLAQAVQQIMAWGEQYGQMAQQIEQYARQIQQMEQQYNSLNGIRNMGDLVNNPLTRNYLPKEYSDMLRDGVGNWNAIHDAMKRFDDENSPIDAASQSMKDFLQYRKQVAINRASTEEAYKSAGKRFDDIQVLLNKVNAAPDSKDIADLQARIQAEQAMIQNEANKLEAMRQLTEAQRAVQSQQIKERQMQTELE